MRTRLLGIAILLTGLAGAAGVVAVSGPGSASAFTLGGLQCQPISMAAATPVGVAPGGGCTGVRPGAPVLTEQGGCTLNFVWKGSDGDTYVGTAGHCALGASGPDERTWAPGEGPPAGDAQGNPIGEFAYAVVDDPRDFALIRLDDGIAASPEMCHFGGPTGINADRPGPVLPTLLQQYGQGLGVAGALPARTHVALGMPDPDHVFAIGAVLPGDSGSAVTTPDGRAVGVVVTTGLHAGSVGLGGLDAGTVGITRIGPQIARAEQATGVDYTLQTAPVL